MDMIKMETGFSEKFASYAGAVRQNEHGLSIGNPPYLSPLAAYESLSPWRIFIWRSCLRCRTGPLWQGV